MRNRKTRIRFIDAQIFIIIKKVVLIIFFISNFFCKTIGISGYSSDKCELNWNENKQQKENSGSLKIVLKDVIGNQNASLVLSKSLPKPQKVWKVFNGNPLPILFPYEDLADDPLVTDNIFKSIDIINVENCEVTINLPVGEYYSHLIYANYDGGFWVKDRFIPFVREDALSFLILFGFDNKGIGDIGELTNTPNCNSREIREERKKSFSCSKIKITENKTTVIEIKNNKVEVNKPISIGRKIIFPAGMMRGFLFYEHFYEVKTHYE